MVWGGKGRINIVGTVLASLAAETVRNMGGGVRWSFAGLTRQPDHSVEIETRRRNMKTIADFVAAVWKDESGITSIEYAVLLALGVGGVVVGAEILDTSAQTGAGWATVR